MGYTTEFDGEFKLNKQLDTDTLLRFQDVLNSDVVTYKGNGLDLHGYCKWAPNKYATAIKWDGNEKFYDYEEWLNYLIKVELAPKGYVLNGKVMWRGEEMEDVGFLLVSENVVTAIKQEFELLIECPNCGEDIYKAREVESSQPPSNA